MRYEGLYERQMGWNNTSDIDHVCLVLWKVVEMPSLLTM